MEPAALRILLVEDNAVEAQLLQELLADTVEPFQVTRAELMGEAEACLRQSVPDAVLLDLTLPDSRGLVSVERVHALTPQVPIIVLTGLDDEATGIEAIRRGAQDYLIKGHADGRLLTRSVRYAIERKHSEEQILALNADLEQRVIERTAVAQHRADQLRALAAELTLTEQRERRRLAQVLHDHLQQLLVATRLKVGSLNRRLRDETLRPIVSQIDELLNDSLDASRSLTVDLSPPVLYDVGLGPALDWLARHMRSKHSLEVTVEADAEVPRLAEDTRILLFTAARELLNNVVEHAGAQRACVRMARSDGHVCVLVSDDGSGFDLARLKADGGHSGRFGLFSIRERVEMFGGCLTVDSALGKGTRVEIWVPAGEDDGSGT
jgi:signal transduction histidine kinase